MVFFAFIHFCRTFYRANSGDPGQRLHSTAPESALFAFVPQKGRFALNKKNGFRLQLFITVKYVTVCA